MGFNEERRNSLIEGLGSWSFTGLSVAGVVNGLALHPVGPRLLAGFGLAVFAAGAALVALARLPGSEPLVAAGLFLMSYGGHAPYLVGFNMACLFQKRQALFISLVSAAFNVTGFLPMLFSSLYASTSSSSSRGGLFIAWASAAAVCAGLAVLLLPRHALVPGDAPSSALLDACSRSAARSRGRAPSSILATPPPSGAMPAAAASLPPSPLLSLPPAARQPAAAGVLLPLARLLRSPQLLLLCLWFGASLLYVSFMCASVNGQLQLKDPEPACRNNTLNGSFYSGGGGGGGANASSTTLTPCRWLTYSTLFQTITNLGFLLNPMIGLLIPRMGLPASAAAANLSSQLFVLLMLVPGIQATPAAFALMSVQKSFLFTTFFAYVAATWPGPLYGQVVALATGTAALLSLLIAPLSDWAAGRDFGAVNIAQAAMTLPLYALPLLMRRSEARRLQQEQLEDEAGAGK